MSAQLSAPAGQFFKGGLESRPKDSGPLPSLSRFLSQWALKAIKESRDMAFTLLKEHDIDNSIRTRKAISNPLSEMNFIVLNFNGF